MNVASWPFIKSDGRVGGFQCNSAYCAEPLCFYVLISAISPIRPGTRCPSHKIISR